ncbi:hypothetical protein B0H11DRAFT_2025971 [Mycena galericulata]|nr:hypothetical protein B0H11DRAFT_2025971 [Mycena galericulata]
MQRAVISYDDITLPYESPPPRAAPSSSSNASQSKKRKWSNQKPGQQQANKNGKAVSHGAPPVAKEDEEEEEAEDGDSRYLTSEEIWDDSALIDAWNAATEEYEAFNGPDKGWKNEPVKKSPLWYNVPPTKPPKKKLKTEAADEAPLSAEGDSKPLDFDTFVPNYDASLALPAPLAPGGVPEYGEGYDYSALPPPGVAVASQDEAFARALGAMYWGGYWTAVYHCHRSAQRMSEGEGTGDDEGEEEEDVREEAFVPTQR